MASVELRKKKDGTDSWRVSVRKKGFPEVCKTFLSQTEAEEWAKAIENSMDDVRNKKADDIPALPLSVFLERYKSEIIPLKPYGKKEIVYLDFWQKHLGNEIATQISPAKLDLYANTLYNLKGRRGNNLGPETRRKYLAHLSIVYTTAIKKWHWALYNPVSGVDSHWEKIREKRAKPDKSLEDISFVDEFKKKFCFAAHQQMQKENLSQREVAAKSKLSLHTVQFALDAKNNPTIKNLLKVAQSLDIKIEIIC